MDGAPAPRSPPRVTLGVRERGGPESPDRNPAEASRARVDDGEWADDAPADDSARTTGTDDAPASDGALADGALADGARTNDTPATDDAPTADGSPAANGTCVEGTPTAVLSTVR